MYQYTYLRPYILSRLQVDYQRFLSQAFHRYVIQVIASYKEAFLGKSENTLHTFGKGHAIQEIQIPPK